MPDKLLVIIESPGKIKKVSQYLKELGYDAIVKASMGHIRELADAGECNRGFDLEGTRVHSHWQVNSGKKKNVEEIRKLTKGRTVVLATDGDREGESISWHLAETLKLKNPQRMVYQEITKDAIARALKQLRPLDMGLVGAALARAHLDKDVGYCGTQLVVWPLNIGARSMGRVQTAALAIAADRERQIRTFKPQNYYSLSVDYAEGFKAFYRGDRAQTATAAPEEDAARDDAQESGEDKQSESDRITSQAEAERIVTIARQHPHQVVSVEQKQAFQKPPEPFTTSTLQQAAGTRFKYRPDKTMELAQKLYEGGFITYMRTDSVALAETFCAAVRKYLEQTDPKNVPQKTAQFRNKAGAQEAHEAVRPTDIAQTPEKLKGQLPDDQLSLYALIWQRTIATQCAPAELNKVRVVVQAGTTAWEARGQTVVYAGYTRYWSNLGADTLLPPLKQGQGVKPTKVNADLKQTAPPSRYTEPTLVREMEKRGVGRPSTYASTIATLFDRQYIALGKEKQEKGKIVVTALGLELMLWLEKLLPNIAAPRFTAEMERALDEIALGKLKWEAYVHGFHEKVFGPSLLKAQQLIEQMRAAGTLSTQRKSK